MDITITFQEGEWVTEPNPAIVVIGTKVRWIFRAPKINIRHLRWTVKFLEKSPFQDRSSFTIETNNTYLGQRLTSLRQDFARFLDELGMTEEEAVDHRGTTPPVPVELPDDYKYSLEVKDADTEEPIGEEDPRLIVVPPPPPIKYLSGFR